MDSWLSKVIIHSYSLFLYFINVVRLYPYFIKNKLPVFQIILHWWKMEKQECIPVWYVLPASMATIRCQHMGVSVPFHRDSHFTETPWHRPLPDRESPLDRESPPDIHPRPPKEHGTRHRDGPEERWDQAGSDIIQRPPWRNRCKSITLPQTSFLTVTSYLYLLVITVSWICYNNPCLWVPNIDQSTVCTPILPVEGEYYM